MTHRIWQKSKKKLKVMKVIQKKINLSDGVIKASREKEWELNTWVDLWNKAALRVAEEYEKLPSERGAVQVPIKTAVEEMADHKKASFSSTNEANYRALKARKFWGQ